MAETQNGTVPNFANPTNADMPAGQMEYHPLVDYAAMKTAEMYVGTVTTELCKEARSKFKLGFHFWDSKANEGNGARIAIDKFSFVVIETYSAISGYVEKQAGQPGDSYYSNNVKDSKLEPFTLFKKGQKKPVMSGYYMGKKSETDTVKLCAKPNIESNDAFNAKAENHVIVPKGVSFHQHYLVWWIEGNRMLELKLTTMISREIKNAVSEAFGRSSIKKSPDSINLFRLADKSLWMFIVKSFKKVTKDGQPYNGKGEMFLVPLFECGTIPENTESAENSFYDEMRSIQAEVREQYEAEKVRRQQYRNSDGSIDTAQMQATQEQPNIAQPMPSVADAPPAPGDDLPF